MVLFAGMAAVGFALEFCIVLLTPRFVAFALLPIIIVQVCRICLRTLSLRQLTQLLPSATGQRRQSTTRAATAIISIRRRNTFLPRQQRCSKHYFQYQE